MALQPQERFFSYNKPLDWASGYAANLDIGEAVVTVRRSETYTLDRIVRSEEIEGAHALTDIAVAQGSKLYALDERANVWVYDMRNHLTETLFRHGHQLFGERALLAAAGDVLFIADANSERRLVAVSPTNGQLIWARQEWAGGELRPLALAADSRKHAYVLVPFDVRVDAEGHPGIPAEGRLALLEWNESGGVENVYEHESLRLAEAATLHELRDRYRIAVAAGGEPAVWDAKQGTIVAFRGEKTESFAVASDGLAQSNGFAIDGAGCIYIGGIADDGNDERCILKLSPSGNVLAKLRAYRGRTDKLLIDDRERMYAWNAESGEVAVLDLQARTTELEETGMPMAVFLSAELDCTEEETVWHKIRLEADIPDETQVRLSYFASDRRDGILEGNWVVYSDYFQDPRVPLRDKLRASSRLWSEPIVNPKDALLRGAKGRYLWFKLELVGSYVHAPSVHKLRVYFPRTSLMSYLPPIYQEEWGDEQFLERFLAIFGTFFSEMETTIERISTRFDPDSAHGDYLKWLSGWLAIESSEDWSEQRLRELMRQAPDLYKRRGTREGLARMLAIYTGKEPYIVEYHQVKAMLESSELRLLFERLYGDNPYCFTVMLPPECVRTDKQRIMIESIIDDQKPAYAEGRLIVLEPWMYADVHTYLGINTVLSEPTLLTLDQRSAMPYQTLLVDVDRDRRMDVHTRLELDSELD